jgi:hypothetical protein
MTTKLEVEAAILESTKKWVGHDFSSIPGALVQRAFKASPEDLVLLAGGSHVSNCCDAEVVADDPFSCTACQEECEVHWSGAEQWPAGWGTLFRPTDPFDEEWIEAHADEVGELGFLVYESDETGILLGIDGAGYDFFERHWVPLYKARGLKWHKAP